MRLHIESIPRSLAIAAVAATIAIFTAAAGAVCQECNCEGMCQTQCPGGCCNGSCPSQSFQSSAAISERRPSPAWRYEKAVAHRAAVVRVFCREEGRSRSIGSGVLVRWSGRVVALTARHVVTGAKTITIELHTKRVYRATVLKVDPVWDCAVLEIDAPAAALPTAQVQRGKTAVLHAGDRLESCGYGADGLLAVNSGRFLGYRRSTETPQGPDDWFEISGRARLGDSGGPIFNERGHVVGVLWGTNGEVVVGVQAGRLHLLLDSAQTPTRWHTADAADVLDRKTFTLTAYEMERHPTAPKGDDASDGDACDCPDSSCDKQPILPGPLPYEPYVDETKKKGKSPKEKTPALPWRKETQQHDNAQDAKINDLARTQEQQSRQIAAANAAANAANNTAANAAAAAAAPKAEPAPPTPRIEAEHKSEASPLAAALCMAGAVGAAAAMYYLTTKS